MEAPAPIASVSQYSAANNVNDTCETILITDMTRFGFVAFIQCGKLHKRVFLRYDQMYGVCLCVYVHIQH